VNYYIHFVANLKSLNTKKDHRVQSVPITTKVVSSNPVHGEVYSTQHYVIRFVSDLLQIVFSGCSGFFHQ